MKKAFVLLVLILLFMGCMAVYAVVDQGENQPPFPLPASPTPGEWLILPTITPLPLATLPPNWNPPTK